MKKYTIFYALFFVVSNQAFAQMSCESLLDRAPVLVAKKNFSKSYQLALEQIRTVRDSESFAAVFSENQKPDWHAYNNISILLQTLESPAYIKLSNIEKLSLEKEFSVKNAELKKMLNESLSKPEFLEAYKKQIDENYAFFALLEKVNEKAGVPVFPKARLDLTVSNRETIAQGEKLLIDLNNTFEKDFAEHSGFKSLEEYKKTAENFDETAKRTVELLEDQVIVAMHRPDNARFWIPLTGFQNQRVTGSSKGYLGGDYRSQAESALLRMPKEDFIKNSVRFMPKYAEVIVGTEVKDIKNGRGADQYGNDLWIIKKSTVKKRATWTPQDSLGPGGYGTHATALDGFLPWSFRLLATPYLHNYIKNYKQFYPDSGLNDLKIKSDTWRYGSSYMEVQIFGDVSINDVEAFHFRAVPPDADFMKMLKSKNIKVYDARGEHPVIYTGGL